MLRLGIRTLIGIGLLLALSVSAGAAAGDKVVFVSTSEADVKQLMEGVFKSIQLLDEPAKAATPKAEPKKGTIEPPTGPLYFRGISLSGPQGARIGKIWIIDNNKLPKDTKLTDFVIKGDYSAKISGKQEKLTVIEAKVSK